MVSVFDQAHARCSHTFSCTPAFVLTLVRSTAGSPGTSLTFSAPRDHERNSTAHSQFSCLTRRGGCYCSSGPPRRSPFPTSGTSSRTHRPYPYPTATPLTMHRGLKIFTRLHLRVTLPVAKSSQPRGARMMQCWGCTLTDGRALCRTNTCCSHPLFGFSPTEVDTPADVASGDTPGVKRAAIRKLAHELGVDPAQIDIKQFKFLTRLHYWAADVVRCSPLRMARASITRTRCGTVDQSARLIVSPACSPPGDAR